jgi:hypothetical protein
VQSSLPPGSVAVEFIHFPYQNVRRKTTDSMMYAALVLRPGSAGPDFIPLFEERDLAALLAGASGGNVRRINALYAPGSGKAPLYDLIWKKIEPSLSGSTTVYCALSGLLHRINPVATFRKAANALPGGPSLVVLGSTRQLALGPGKAARAASGAWLLGGIRYTPDEAAINALLPAFAQTRSPLHAETIRPDTLTRGDSWAYLPGTATEVLELRRMMVSAGLSVRLDTGYAATEDAVQLAGRGEAGPAPRILHFATHGYFFPNAATPSSAGGPVFKTSALALLRSGLILAGAQQVWTSGLAPANREDGVLTAAEISRMNLSGTELVVLSACETGLGDLHDNEGVFGLQRAFKIAGARHVVMSLWKVNDLTTREFMLDFYEQWLRQGLSLPDAFRQAQRHMQAKYPADPYHWAGFVLVE